MSGNFNDQNQNDNNNNNDKETNEVFDMHNILKAKYSFDVEEFVEKQRIASDRTLVSSNAKVNQEKALRHRIIPDYTNIRETKVKSAGSKSVPKHYSNELKEGKCETYHKVSQYLALRAKDRVHTVDLSDATDDKVLELLVNNLMVRLLHENNLEEFSNLLNQLEQLLLDKQLLNNVFDDLTKGVISWGRTRYKTISFTDTEVMKAFNKNAGKYNLLMQYDELRVLMMRLISLELSTFVEVRKMADIKLVYRTFEKTSISEMELVNILTYERFMEAIKAYIKLLTQVNNDDEFSASAVMSRAAINETLIKGRKVLTGSLVYITNYSQIIKKIKILIATKQFNIHNNVLALKSDLFERPSFKFLNDISQLVFMSIFDKDTINEAILFDITESDFNMYCDLMMNLINQSNIICLENVNDLKERFTMKAGFDYNDDYESLIIIENYKASYDNRVFRHMEMTKNPGTQVSTHQFNELPYINATNAIKDLNNGFQILATDQVVWDFVNLVKSIGCGLRDMYYDSILDEEFIKGNPNITNADMLAISFRNGEFTILHNFNFDELSGGFRTSQLVAPLTPNKEVTTSILESKSVIKYTVNVKGKEFSGARKSMVKSLLDEVETSDPIIYMWLQLFAPNNNELRGSASREVNESIPLSFKITDEVLLADGDLLGNFINIPLIAITDIAGFEIKYPVSLQDYSLSMLVHNGRIYSQSYFQQFVHKSISIIEQLQDVVIKSLNEEKGAKQLINGIQRQMDMWVMDTIVNIIKTSKVYRKLINDYTHFIFRALSNKSGVNITNFRSSYMKRTFNSVGLQLFGMYGIITDAIYKEDLNFLIDSIINLDDILISKDIFDMI